MKQYWVVKYGETYRLTMDKLATVEEACIQCFGLVVKDKMVAKGLGGNKRKIMSDKWFQSQLKDEKGWIRPNKNRI